MDKKEMKECIDSLKHVNRQQQIISGIAAATIGLAFYVFERATIRRGRSTMGVDMLTEALKRDEEERD